MTRKRIKEQTAVAYLVEHLMPKQLTAKQFLHIEKAKEIEAIQISMSFDKGAILWIRANYLNGMEYFKENFLNL